MEDKTLSDLDPKLQQLEELHQKIQADLSKVWTEVERLQLELLYRRYKYMVQHGPLPGQASLEQVQGESQGWVDLDQE
jgi:chromosome segregation ATPase